MSLYYFYFFIPMFCYLLNSSADSYIKTEQILVQSISNDSLPTFLPQLNDKYHQSNIQSELIIEHLNIWLLTFDPKVINSKNLIKTLKNHHRVRHVQFNHKIQDREIPNDTKVKQQWQYQNKKNLDADIDAMEAWNITTGGKTLDNQEIVVAVLDRGIRLSHPDFEDNIWLNKHEIPNNGIDDDDNGYIDDIYGWNFESNNNDISNGGVGATHGTPVAGIIGAKGNNGIGVSGINWDIKIMNIIRGTSESDALKAYNYILQMRKKYNETNGAAGAFIVASNASWGTPYGQAEDAPIWCEMYNQLGQVGILNAAATENLEIDVEIEGDLPARCPSDYLICVTNTTSADRKLTGSSYHTEGAAYGLLSIDMGAPGAKTFTAKNTGQYGHFGGTSAATPHVTGAIALLYSVPSSGLIEDIRTDPAKTALLMKSFIMSGTDPLEDLKGITVTGGRLNLYKSILQLQKYYGIETPANTLDYEVDIQNIFPNPATDFVTIQFELTTTASLFAIFYNSLGQKVKQIPFSQTTQGNHEKRIDISDLQRGIYYLTIRHNNQPVKAIKLIVDN